MTLRAKLVFGLLAIFLVCSFVSGLESTEAAFGRLALASLVTALIIAIAED